ncbi:MAG: NAD(P)-dependent alcohol dehydrogenase [Deltaproteobacteria bacterium]|nr:MAG: NAD(P)-dependent alcohol dehydrogenase [Deltaproteobacteria bacterium]
MKAMQYSRYGGVEVLEWVETPRPEPKAGQLLVRVHTFSVNPIDWKMMSGKLRLVLRAPNPCTPCFDLCGVVEEVGPEVKGFAVGDRILTREPGLHGGAAAEFAVVRADAAALAPDGVSDVSCAAAPLVAQTALQGLRLCKALEVGKQVLVVGASGGVGHLAVQIAKLHGAQVTGVCSTRNVEFVRSLGADEVIDYSQTDDYGQGRFDAVLDCAGKAPWKILRRALKPGGVVGEVSPSVRHFWPMLTLPLYSRKRLKPVMLDANGEDMQTIASWMGEGKLTVEVEQVYEGLQELPKAFERNESGRTRGKLVIQVA